MDREHSSSGRAAHRSPLVALRAVELCRSSESTEAPRTTTEVIVGGCSCSLTTRPRLNGVLPVSLGRCLRVPNFRELRQREVRRIHLPRNPVNSAGRRTGARRSGPMVAALYNAATFLPPSLTHLFSTTENPFLHPPRGGGQGCGHRGASARQEGDRKRPLHQTGSDLRDCTSAIY